MELQLIAKQDVTFEYGLQVDRDEMEPSTIYLDGVVRGPAVDNDKKSYSFDHHGDCLRMSTLATCQQVRLALELGLDPTGFEAVLNDLDADASLGLWLLRYPSRALEKRVEAMVRRIGFVDAHGPMRPPTRLHRVLTHGPDQKFDEQVLWHDQDLIEAWYQEGDEALPEPEPGPKSPGFGLTRAEKFEEFDELEGFAALYERGLVVGMLCPEAEEGTRGYTIAKRSEFVDYDIREFLERIDSLEAGWGGASTIGGAPRREGGRRSELPVAEVRRVFLEVA